MKTMRLALAVACVAGSMLTARAEEGPIKVGIASDTSGIYAEIGGDGVKIAAQMAVDDFGGTVLGRKIEIMQSDTQDKPDVASAFVRDWYDQQGVSMVLDGSASSVGLAIQAIAFQRHKIYLDSGGYSSAFVGTNCTPTTAQFVPSTRGLSVAGLNGVVAKGLDTWFFITADYAFGHALRRDAAEIIQKQGGKVVGAALHPLGTSDYSAYMIQAQASKAKGLALANAGGDLVNAIKQAHEFGLTSSMQLVGLLVLSADINAIGPKYAEGFQFSTTTYAAQSPETLAWSRRFMKLRGGRAPTDIHVLNYVAMLHWLKAVQAAGTLETDKVMAKMHEMPVNDIFVHNAPIRADGRLMADLTIVRVKPASAVTDPLDNLDVVAKVPASTLYPAEESDCPLLRTGSRS